MQANSSRVKSLRTISSSERVLSSFIKHDTRHFYVAVTAKKCREKDAAPAKLLFCLFNLKIIIIIIVIKIIIINQ